MDDIEKRRRRKERVIEMKNRLDAPRFVRGEDSVVPFAWRHRIVRSVIKPGAAYKTFYGAKGIRNLPSGERSD